MNFLISLLLLFITSLVSIVIGWFWRSGRVSSLKAEVREHTSRYSRIRSDLDRQTDQVKLIEGNFKLVKNEKSELTADLAEWILKHKKVSDELTKLKSQFKTMDQEQTASQGTPDGDKKNDERTILELQKKCSSYEKGLASWELKYNDLQDQLEKIQKEHTQSKLTLENEIGALEKGIAAWEIRFNNQRLTNLNIIEKKEFEIQKMQGLLEGRK